MSLLEKASLIITPNSYKESKLYSVIPNTTLGDMDVVRATTATRVNSSGLIESVGVNIPRIDYTNGSCPSILVEPQRTNIALYSEQFDNSYWTEQNLNLITNNSISPNGTLDADTLEIINNNGQHNIYSASNVITPNIDYTFSYFVKKGTGRYIAVCFVYVGGDFGPYATYDLNTNTLVASGAIAGTFTSSKLETFANGWVKISVTGKGNYTNVILAPDIRNSINLIPGVSFIGANETFSIWGAQFESGSYATSYIPTVASSVTRNADVIYKTGISSLIGQTEGTLFAEFYHNGQDVLSTQQVLFVSSGNTNNYLAFGVYDGRLNPGVRASSTDIFDLLVGPNPLPQGKHKVALAYKTGDFAVYLDGVSIYTNTNSATFGTMSQLDLGTTLSFNTQLGDGIKSAQLYKTRLTNTELAQLTTL